MYGYKLTITGVYVVNDDSPVGEKNELFQQLHEITAKVGQSKE